MASNVPITNGQGQSSVAAEEIGTVKYQVIKIVGGQTGSTSVMGVNPDTSINVSVFGTVVTVAPAGSIASVTFPAGSVTAVSFSAATNTSVSGAITAPPGSVMTVAALAGSVMGISGTVTAPAGSIASITIPAGSVTAVRTDNASVLTVATVVGSVITALQAASVVGTYAEDAAHTSGEKGLFVLGVRNDLMSSVTSADLDYSPVSLGPIGEMLVADAPISKWISGTADHRITLGASIQALPAGGTSVFTYLTGIQVSNMGPASVLVTISGGLGSILGYTIAPAGGGSNVVYKTPLRTGENSKITTSISGIASVLVSAQGFSAKI